MATSEALLQKGFGICYVFLSMGALIFGKKNEIKHKNEQIGSETFGIKVVILT